MASVRSMAITREQAYAALKETTGILAEHFGIDAPVLDIHKRYPLEYRQAQELQRMAAFLEQVVQRLDGEPVHVPAAVSVPTAHPVRPAVAKVRRGNGKTHRQPSR